MVDGYILLDITPPPADGALTDFAKTIISSIIFLFRLPLRLPVGGYRRIAASAMLHAAHCRAGV
jgi:hypothetical protein